MTARKGLSVVKAGDKPATPEKPLTLAQAVESGDYYKILVAQRREIAQAIPDEKGPAKAALHRQLSLIAKEIEGLDAAQEQEAREDEVAPDDTFDASAI